MIVGVFDGYSRKPPNEFGVYYGKYAGSALCVVDENRLIIVCCGDEPVFCCGVKR